MGTIVLVDRTVLLVDAGHLLSGGGSLTVAEHKRTNLDVDVCKLLMALVERVEEDAGLPLLRTYWYDGAREGRPSAEHSALRELDYTKLRLGRLVQGRQKGVDALIYRDLTTLARQRSIVTAYLVAGDEDLCEGVAEAQSLGVQVCLLAVEPAGNSDVSQALVHEADRVIDLDEDFLSPFFAARAPVVPPLGTQSAEPG
ncbi:NYN domain-containing protein [Blastococcus sp. KM273128]|nr:NYN domain-containing protein [Blastococcus sp. KM273128]